MKTTIKQLNKLLYILISLLRKEKTRKTKHAKSQNKEKPNKKKKITKAIIAAAVPAVIIYAYNRSDYKHWIDSDKDCQNTRQEVLIEESLEEVTLDKKGCKAIQGKWYDPYTDRYFTNPQDLDIDHFIPLKEVHVSGGQYWDKERKKLYANDLDNSITLIAVYKGANRSKGAKDPSEWMPKNEKYHCEYIKTWQEVKKKWELGMDEKEKEFIYNKNEECIMMK